MFTGIIERSCPVVGVCEQQGRRRLTLDLAPLRGAQAVPGPGSGADEPLTALGDSIALDGVCLTVAALDGDRACFDVIAETLERTTLGEWTVGRRTNVERALRFGDRVDGHLVQGHVQTTGVLDAVDVSPAEVRLGVRCGPEFARSCLLKGSLALDGVSLTVAELQPERLVVALVPHTLEITGLGRLQPGARVNLEADMIGQWVIRAVASVR